MYLLLGLDVVFLDFLVLGLFVLVDILLLDFRFWLDIMVWDLLNYYYFC